MRDHQDPIKKLEGFSIPKTFRDDLPWIIGMAAIVFLLIEITV
jgi:hypothetical protein